MHRYARLRAWTIREGQAFHSPLLMMKTEKVDDWLAAEA